MSDKIESFELINDEDDLLQSIKAMRAEAEDAISQRIKVARKSWLYLLGSQYLIEEGEALVDAEVPSWKFRLTRNIVAPVVDTLAPILSQARPKYFIRADFPDMEAVISDNDIGMPIPTGMTDKELAEKLETILDATHQRRGEGLEISKLLMDVLVNGTGFRKIHYCPYMQEIKLPIIPMEDVLVDPMGTRLDFQDSKYVIVRTYLDAADIEHLYGVKESDYAEGADTDQSADHSVKSGRGFLRRVRNYFKAPRGELTTETRYERNRYPVLEVYFDADHGISEAFDYRYDEERQQANRSRVVVCINEQKIVYDQPNPYWHNEFPIIGYTSSPLPHVFHGRSEVEPLLSIQDGTNILYNTVIANALLMSNSQWLIEDGSVDYGDLTNQPGLIVPVEDIGKVQRIPPAPIPGDVLGLVKELEQTAQEQVSGVSPVLQGQAPGSNVSGKLVSLLTGNAYNRQVPKIQSLDVSYRRQARVEVSLLQQYKEFDDPRETRTYDQGENLLFNEAMRELLYSVEIESKADAPLNMTDRINYAFAMVQSGVFDVKEFIRYTGVELSEERRAEIFDVMDQAQVLQQQLANNPELGLSADNNPAQPGLAEPNVANQLGV